MTLGELIVDYLDSKGLSANDWPCYKQNNKNHRLGSMFVVHVEHCDQWTSVFYMEVYTDSVRLWFNDKRAGSSIADRTVNMTDPNSLELLEKKIREVIVQMKNITTDREAKTRVCNNKETIL